MASYEEDLSAYYGSSWTDELTSIRSYIAEKSADYVATPREPLDLLAVDVGVWLDGLPEPLQRVFQHIYTEDRSQREAAKLMHISQPRVAQLHQQLLTLGRRDLQAFQN